MEVDAAFFSVAFPRERDRERLVRQDRENREYVEYLRRDRRVSVLEGELHAQDGGRIEEKLVDVLCAVETIRQAKLISDPGDAAKADAVVVLSQDADLAPGIGLAQDFGVPVLWIAPGKVDRRGHPFVVIAEPAVADLVEAGGPCGQELRRRVAEAAASPTVDSWEYLYSRDVSGRGRVGWMKHRHGMAGVCDLSLVSDAERGELYDLGPRGVLPARGTEFPVLELGATPRRSGDLMRGEVVGRFRLFQATVDVGGGEQVRPYVPNSFLTPGTRVLLQRLADGQVRYVGALGEPPPLVGCGGIEMEAVSVLATVVEHRKSHAVGTVDESGIEVFVPNGAARAPVGGTHLVSLVGSGRSADAAFVAHLASTPLPVSS
jgi:hypothetical protein